MENNDQTKSKAPIFTMWIVVIIVGAALWRNFDFRTFQFEHTGLGIVYLLTFSFAVYVLVKNRKRGDTPAE